MIGSIANAKADECLQTLETHRETINKIVTFVKNLESRIQALEKRIDALETIGNIHEKEVVE